MNHSQFARMVSVGILNVALMARMGRAGDWPKLLDHPPVGANTVVLINADTLRFGAAKLKQFNEGQQQAAAADLQSDLPEHAKRAAISAKIDFDTLEPIWESATVVFEKNIPTPRGIAEHEGGYVDQISGKPAVWSPRGRYIMPHGADRVSVYSSYSFNDNTAYNEGLERQAHAEGMQQHLTNMQQVDNLTAEIRRQMTERYMIEF